MACYDLQWTLDSVLFIARICSPRITFAVPRCRNNIVRAQSRYITSAIPISYTLRVGKRAERNHPSRCSVGTRQIETFERVCGKKTTDV